VPSTSASRTTSFGGSTSTNKGSSGGHTKHYGIDKLVYFEQFATARDAIQREKNMKHWPRAYKTRLVGQANPQWRDLFDEIAT